MTPAITGSLTPAIDIRTLRCADEVPTPEAATAYLRVREALASITTDQHNLNEGEAELVDACVRALRTLPLAELRSLAGSRLPRLPSIDDAEPQR